MVKMFGMGQIDYDESGFGDEKLWPSAELTREDAIRADLVSQWWADQDDSKVYENIEAAQEAAEEWASGEYERISGENPERNREEIHRLAVEAFGKDEIAPEKWADTVTLTGTDGERITLSVEEAARAFGPDNKEPEKRRATKGLNGKRREANA